MNDRKEFLKAKKKNKKEAYYKVYLKSKWWKKLKKELLNKHAKCFVCGNNKNLVIHHMSYNNLFNEIINKDIIILCNKCHNAAHKRFLIEEMETISNNQFLTIMKSIIFPKHKSTKLN